MSMMEAVRSVFSKYAAFSGRARRSEYWYFQLFTLLMHLVFSVFLFRTGEGTRVHSAVTVLESLFSLGVFLPNLAVTWRRFHDIGRSGLWSLLGFFIVLGYAVFIVVLAVVYAATGSSASDMVMGTIGLTMLVFLLAALGLLILLLVWLCQDSQHGDNRFGPDPKRPELNTAEGEKAPWEY